MSEKQPGLLMLETLAAQMGCVYLSDLRCLPPDSRTRLREILQKIPASSAPPEVWNETAFYLAALPAASSAEEARRALLAWAGGSGNRTLKTEGGAL